MQQTHRIVAVVWVVLGIVVIAAAVVDVGRIALEIVPWSAIALSATVPAAVVAAACLYLGTAMWRSLPTARPVATWLCVPGGAIACLSMAANGHHAVMFGSLSHASSAVVATALASFFLLTFRISRQLGIVTRT